MNIHDATETAYKNGYAKGYADGKGEWISVEEKLPDKQGHFLIVDEKQNMFIALWTKQFGWFMHVRNRDKITHWMPLPEPPKGE